MCVNKNYHYLPTTGDRQNYSKNTNWKKSQRVPYNLYNLKKLYWLELGLGLVNKSYIFSKCNNDYYSPVYIVMVTC